MEVPPPPPPPGGPFYMRYVMLLIEIVKSWFTCLLKLCSKGGECLPMDVYYKWTLIVTLMNSCTCLCQKYHNDILNMPARFDVMIVTVTFPG